MRIVKRFYAVAALGLTALAAACDGSSTNRMTPPTPAPRASATGTPASSPTPKATSTPTPTPAPTATPRTTTAKGILVDDPSGSPLAGVNVRVAPWKSYAVPGPSPTPIAASTTAADGSFTVSEPDGTYLLVIGSDDPADMTRPTIHDKIVLNGQTTLTAPTPAPVPDALPDGVETSGSYRLVSIDAALEAPCMTAFQDNRAAQSLSKPVADEWLIENDRLLLANQQNGYSGGPMSPENPFGYLTSNNTTESAGADCTVLAQDSVTAPAAGLQPGIVWVGGFYASWQKGAAGLGVMQYPQDPRNVTDPSAVPWY